MFLVTGRTKRIGVLKKIKQRKKRFLEDEDEEEDIVKWKIRDEHGKNEIHRRITKWRCFFL